MMKRIFFISFSVLLFYSLRAQKNEILSNVAGSLLFLIADNLQQNVHYPSAECFTGIPRVEDLKSSTPMTVRTTKGNRISGVLVAVSDSMINVYPSARRHLKKGKRYANISISYTNIYRIAFRISNGGRKRIHIVNGDIVKFYAFCKWYADKTKH